MKEQFGLSQKLLSSVADIMKGSTAKRAEEQVAQAGKLSTNYARMGAAKPLSDDAAKLAAEEARAPAKRVADTISQVYAKSVAETKEQAVKDAEYMNRQYSKIGAVKPISEEAKEKPASKDLKANVNTDPYAKPTLKARKTKLQGDVSDSVELEGETIEEAEGTKPKTFREKQLAAKAEPKDKITHADVMKARGIQKEGFAEMDAWLKKRKAEEGTGKFEKKKISTGTVYTRKPEKEKKEVEESVVNEGGQVAGKEQSVHSSLRKMDVPAYLRKQKGEKPLTLADVKGPRPDSISSKEGLAKLRNEEVEEVTEATHILSGATEFMKKHAKAALDKVGAKIAKITHDEDSGTSEYHVSHNQRSRVLHASKELEKKGKESYGGLVTNEAMRPGFDWEAAAKRTKEMKEKGYERGDNAYTWKKIKPEDKKDTKKTNEEVNEEAGFSGPHKVNLPGHPEHGKVVTVVGTAKDMVGTKVVKHSDGKTSQIKPEHLSPVKEEVTLSATELARIEELAKQFDSKE